VVQRSLAAEAYLSAFAAGIRPPADLSVTEWADRFRVLPSTASEPGLYRSSRTPYAREIMESLSANSPVIQVTFAKGSQVGGTEIGLNWLGYIVDVAPGPTLLVQPTKGLARWLSTSRVKPMIDDCPVVKAKVAPERSRSGSNTVLAKLFPGGSMRMIGAEVAADLRQMPARYLNLDEVDEYKPDLDEQGDPIDLAIKRTATFGARRKIYVVSTPTIEGNSKIWELFLQGDQRYFHVPCPHCDHYQQLVFEQLKWEKRQPETVHYRCQACGERIDERHKTEMFERGRWVAKNPQATDRHRSYHLSSLYSPLGWYSWQQLVEDWLKAQGIPAKLKLFWNHVLGLPFAETGEAPPWEQLYNRRAAYRENDVPMGVLMLTAGVDVQKDRLECEVVGWGRGLRSWSITYLRFDGDPNQPLVWRELDELLERKWVHAGGSLISLTRLAIDCGFLPNKVTEFIRRSGRGRTIAVRGQEFLAETLGQAKVVDLNRQGKRTRRGLRFFPVGTTTAKVELYGQLLMERPVEADTPPGWCEFPVDYTAEYFKMLTAERRRWITTKLGFRKPIWELIRERNEALDCRVYARAAAAFEQLDRFEDEHWRQLEDALGVVAGQAPPQTADDDADDQGQPEQPAPDAPTRGRTGWLDRWRGR